MELTFDSTRCHCVSGVSLRCSALFTEGRGYWYLVREMPNGWETVNVPEEDPTARFCELGTDMQTSVPHQHVNPFVQLS